MDNDTPMDPVAAPTEGEETTTEAASEAPATESETPAM